MSDRTAKGRTVTVEAPADLDPLVVAQAVAGPHVLLKAESRPSWTTRPFERWRALSELYGAVQRVYERRLKAMLGDLDKAVGLRKAAGKRPKPIITPAKMRELQQIIEDHHTVFMLEIGLDDSVTDADKERLRKTGLFSKRALDLIDDAFTYGQITAIIRELDDAKELKDLTYAKFKKLVKEKPVPRTENERRAVEWSKHSTAVHVKAMGQRIEDDFGTITVSEDAKLRREYMGQIRDTVKQGLEERKAWRSIASDLGHKTGDWGRDMMRVAATETQHAMQEGYAEGLIKREGDPETILVAKIPQPSACKHCIRLHLTQGVGSPPRVFKLSELARAGTNVGRKAADWQAIVGPVHPWCSCELVHVPPGMGYERRPPKGKGYRRVKGKKHAWVDSSGNPWSPKMVPDSLRRGLAFTRDLQKSFMTYGDSVPLKGVHIDVSDPIMRAICEQVVAGTPECLFDKQVGVTLITTDIPRPGNAFSEHDLGYWTGNEVRLSQTLKPKQVERVLRHELGHALNVHLIRKMGGEQPVRDWHDGLFAIAKQEGFVSKYASTLPIECAAEATRLYLYDRKKLMLDYPRQFTYLRAAYKDVLP